MNIRSFNSDCLDFTRNIPDGYFDLVIADPPYGKTNLKWDIPFNADDFLSEMLRVTSDQGSVVIFGQNPMISEYIFKGVRWFKYDLTWRKSRKNNYLNANRRPLCETEKIAVFSKGQINPRTQDAQQMFYNPFSMIKRKSSKKNYGKGQKHVGGGCKANNFISEGKHYPTDIIEIDSLPKNANHPTEKPPELFEYLLLTFSKLGDRVLDPCFGSGNSLLAGRGLNRRMFGVEMDKIYFNNFKTRLNDEPARIPSE